MNPTNSELDIRNLRQQAPGVVVGEILLTATLPKATGWLPPGASMPAGRRESGTLDLRQIDDRCLLSFWHIDGSPLWQESADDRDAAEALAQRFFGVAPERWQARAPAQEQPIGRTFTVTVTRLTNSGAWATWIGIILCAILMMAGAFGSIALGDYLKLGENWKAALILSGILVSMALALVVGFGLPFWILNHFFSAAELHTTSQLHVNADGISLDALGHLPWPALNAIDQVNTESGEPEAVILLSDTWGKLILRASGSNSNIALAGKLLEALLSHWQQARDPASTIFHLLPIRRWWHEALHLLGLVLGIATFILILPHSKQNLFATLLSAPFLGFMVWALVAIMPQHFWSLTAANRVRAFLLVDQLLTDSSNHIRIDLSRATVEYVYWRLPALEMDYLLIRATGTPPLRLAAFDAGWSNFVAAVSERAGQWHDTGPQESREILRDFRG